MATGGSDSTATSDETICIKCCVCAEENRTREAEKYCVDCKDYYCSPCISIHRTFPSMKGHQVLDKSDFKTVGPDGSLTSYPVQRCKDHKTELLSIYCEDHNEVACAQCIAISHRACKKIISIAEEIEDLYHNAKPGDVKLKLRHVTKALEDLKTTREADLKALDEMFVKEVASVKAFKQQLWELLEAAEKETIQELRNTYDTNKTAVSDDIETMKRLIKSMSELVEQFQKLEGNMTQEFISAKCSEKLVVKAKELESTLKGKPVASCHFIPNVDIKECLRRNKNLGNVSLRKENSELISCMKGRLYTVKRQVQVNVKLLNDTRDCSIIGSCITEDGFLLLTDFNNSKLIRVDLNKEKVSDFISLQLLPFSVCTVSRFEAAVSLIDSSIAFVSLGDKMAVTRKLNMNHCCGGIACEDDKLYITDNSRNLFVYDMNGCLIQNIYKDTNGRGIFSRNQYIAISGEGNKVYVTDWDNGLVVLDCQGNYLTILTDSKINHCRGVCTDGRNVFMSCLESTDIVQISPDLKVLGVVRSLVNIGSLCFCQRMSWLVVTREKSNMITKFVLD